MATEKQIAANARNAKRSTGPTTEAGKARSRANALTHGLSGTGPVVEEADRAEVEARLREWGDDLPSDTPLKAWISGRVAHESVRIERCERLYLRTCRDFSDRVADGGWEVDRAREAQEIYSARGSDPALAVRRLEATLQGAQLLRHRWDLLGHHLDDSRDWNAEQRSDALDLLGYPTAYRQGATPIQPRGLEGQALFDLRIRLVLAEMARLEGLIRGPLAISDGFAKMEAGRYGTGAELSAPTRESLRLESVCHRRFQRHRRDLTLLLAGKPVAPAGFAPATPAEVDPFAALVASCGPLPGDPPTRLDRDDDDRDLDDDDDAEDESELDPVARDQPSPDVALRGIQARRLAPRLESPVPFDGPPDTFSPLAIDFPPNTPDGVIPRLKVG